MGNGRSEVCLVSMKALVVAACCRLFVRDVGRERRSSGKLQRALYETREAHKWGEK